MMPGLVPVKCDSISLAPFQGASLSWMPVRGLAALTPGDSLLPLWGRVMPLPGPDHRVVRTR